MGLDEIQIDFGHSLIHDWQGLEGQCLPSVYIVGRKVWLRLFYLQQVTPESTARVFKSYVVVLPRPTSLLLKADPAL